MIALLITAFFSMAWANDSILGPTPKLDDKSFVSEGLDNIFEEPRQVMLAKSNTENKSNYSLGLISGLGIKKYNLTSNGFKAALPVERGLLLGLNAEFSTKNLGWIRAINFEAEYFRYSISSLSGLSRNEVKSKELITDIAPKLFFDSSQHYFLAIGYSFFTREVEATSPNQIMSSPISHSVLLKLGGRENIIKDFFLEGSLKISVPFDYREKTPSSGKYRQSFRSKARVGLRKEFSSLFVSGGFEYLLNWTRFSGRGERGTIEAKEIENEIKVPLGVGWIF
ncbi:MAG: hypothetical protein M9962_11205 [Oligoflexia bacterium]|nr:hypothetical protein [Oligoflexia bacterium]